MKNEFSALSTARQTRGVLSGLGMLCAAATVVVFSTLFFSDVSFTAAVTLELSLDFALLYFSSYVMFCSLFETGMDKAEAGENYRALYARRAALFERFRTEGDCESIFAFCRAVSEKETEEMRKEICLDSLMTEEELQKAKRKPFAEQTVAERRALRRLAKVARVRITPQLLLAEKPSVYHSHILTRSPDALRRRRAVHFLIPTALTALFSASLVFEAVKDPSLDVLIGYLFKIFTLFWSGARGYRSGFTHAECEKTEYMREQCFRLDDYFAAIAKKSRTDPPNQ